MSIDLERIKKIAALAKRGVGGEAKNAQAMLDKILQANGLTLDSLDGDVVTTRFFQFSGKNEQRLLIQIMYKVLNTKKFPIYEATRRGAKLRKLGFDLTDSQYIEAEMMYELYKPALKKHLEIAYHAFLQANNVFGHDPEDKDSKERDEDLAREVMRMAEITKKTNVYKQISGTV